MDLQQAQLEAICGKIPAEYKNHKLLGSGAFNISYLLVTDKGNFVLRIGNSTHTKNLLNEYKILKKLDGEFGPKVFVLDDSLKIIPRIYIIEEFLEGVHPETVFSEELLIAMGEWYSRLHKYKSSTLPEYMHDSNQYSLISSFEWVTIAFYENREILDEEFRTKIHSFYAQAFTIIRKEDKLFSKRKELSLNQGDPSRSNIFYKDGIVKLVDWEFTKYELREWDLAFFVWSRDLTREQKKLFLDAANYPMTKEAEKQFEVIYLLHCLMLLSWMVERLNQVDKDEIDPEQMSSTRKEMMEGIQESLNLLEKSMEIIKEIF